MILIYSNNCKHCNILLETIEKHDKEKIIKIISVDTLNANNYKVEEIIHSIPALILNDTINEENILYGKQVFDHLLLPNRGVLFTQDNNTRLNKVEKDHLDKNNINSDDNIINIDPMAFTLKTSLSDNFSLIDSSSNTLTLIIEKLIKLNFSIGPWLSTYKFNNVSLKLTILSKIVRSNTKKLTIKIDKK